MKILVTNANSRMALCLVRKLNNQGHNVIVADHIKNSMCFYSNRISDSFLYPSPYSFPETFIDFIQHKINELEIECILPIHEETFLLSKNKNKFNEVFIDEFGNIAWERDKNIDSNKEWNNKIDICKDSVYMDSKPME